uniref:Uncharacterized protein n=1 Tax=Equus caballus TaxID=9796 RepID=A0A9L0TD95_HORSE
MKEDCPPSSHVPISNSKSILKSELLSLLKTYNCYHEGRSFQLRHRESSRLGEAGSSCPGPPGSISSEASRIVGRWATESRSRDLMAASDREAATCWLAESESLHAILTPPCPLPHLRLAV